MPLPRLMQERGLEPPAVAVHRGAVVITFVLPALVKTPEKSQTREKSAAAILRMLSEQPEMSIAELAERLDKVPSTIERAVRKLRESGRLQRIGPDKGGRWQVIE